MAIACRTRVIVSGRPTPYLLPLTFARVRDYAAARGAPRLRRDLARAPRDQGRLQHDPARRARVAVEPLEQQLGRAPPELVRVLRDHGQAGPDNVGEQHVVEPDVGELLLQAG